MVQVIEYLKSYLIIFLLIFSSALNARSKKKDKMIDKILINQKSIESLNTNNVSIPQNKIYVKNKIGKTISGVSFARNWRDINDRDLITNDHEIATGNDGIACLATSSDHNILLLPFARVRAKIITDKKTPKLKLRLFSGSALIYVPPNGISNIHIGHSLMDSENGYFYAVNDRKINKYVMGVLTDEVDISNKQIIGDQTINMTTREYVTSGDLPKQKIRKISWQLQKAAKNLMDQCRKNQIDFQKVKKDAKRIYALLNLAKADPTQQQNMKYQPVYDFPEHYLKSRLTTGFGYTGSNYSLGSDSASMVNATVSVDSYLAYARYEKIFDIKNPIASTGLKIESEITLKDSSSIINASGSTKNYLIGFTIGPSFEISETTYFSYLFKYNENDYFNTKTSDSKNYNIDKGSVLSTTYALDKTFELGLNQLHAQVYYSSNLTIPNFSDLYTSNSSLGIRLIYGSIFGGLSYFGQYVSESFTNLEDTRNDTTFSTGLSYTL